MRVNAGNRRNEKGLTSMQVHLVKSLSLASTRSFCKLVIQPWSIRQIRQRSAMFGCSCLLDIVPTAAGDLRWPVQGRTRQLTAIQDTLVVFPRRAPALRHQ